MIQNKPIPIMKWQVISVLINQTLKNLSHLICLLALPMFIIFPSTLCGMCSNIFTFIPTIGNLCFFHFLGGKTVNLPFSKYGSFLIQVDRYLLEVQIYFFTLCTSFGLHPINFSTLYFCFHFHSVRSIPLYLL